MNRRDTFGYSHKFPLQTPSLSIRLNCELGGLSNSPQWWNKNCELYKKWINVFLDSWRFVMRQLWFTGNSIGCMGKESQ